MFRKNNIIVIAFFLILSVKGDYLFSLYLPVLLFYLFKDKRNMYFIFPSSIISLLFFANTYLVLYLVLILITLIFIYILEIGIKKQIPIFLKPNLLLLMYILMINIISLYIYPNTNLIWYGKIIFILLSVLIYLFLDKYLVKLLKDFKNIREKLFTNEHKEYNTYVYLEILLAILTTISASYIELFGYNLSIVVGCYFAMYISRKFKNIYSLIFSIIVLIIEYVVFGINDSLIIIITSGIYLVESIFTIGIYNIILAIIILMNPNNVNNTYITLMIISIAFEIISYYSMLNTKTKEDIYLDLHEKAQQSVNNEILKFAGFLDRFTVGFQNPKGFNEKLSIGIKNIVEKHCNNCPIKNECFNKNKSNLYFVFKDILMFNKESQINHEEFANSCCKYSSILNTSKLLNQKTNYQNPNTTEKDRNNYILLAQISGVSNALKNYVVDTTSKQELNYYMLNKAKECLEDMEYYITYYEVIRSYIDDFLINIGIKNIIFDEIKEQIELLFETITNTKVSVIKNNEENTTTYITVMPKLIIDVTYAYGSIPSEAEAINGDNYLIKEQNNGHILFSISDGMGKGYSAFYESDMTLHLVEDIVQLNIESSTALEILNTFYTVQDYLERYATLDFLDINRHTGTAMFYKMGANTTYIFKENGNIDKIINKSLPLGIEEMVDQMEYKLDSGDLIIMSSDGILENIIDNDKFETYVKKIKSLAPQQIVYEILNYASSHELKVKDDMTVIALKISKN